MRTITAKKHKCSITQNVYFLKNLTLVQRAYRSKYKNDSALANENYQSGLSFSEHRKLFKTEVAIQKKASPKKGPCRRTEKADYSRP